MQPLKQATPKKSSNVVVVRTENNPRREHRQVYAPKGNLITLEDVADHQWLVEHLWANPADSTVYVSCDKQVITVGEARDMANVSGPIVGVLELDCPTGDLTISAVLIPVSNKARFL